MQEKGMLVEVGTYCPNKECDSYGKLGQGNIVRYGKSRQGRQRYKCKVCKK